MISIIILNWNGLEVLRPCLKSLSENTAVDHEVIVYDNGSAETGIEEVVAPYAQVKLVKSEVNHGFARGNNLASKHAQGKYIVFLNNDTLPQPGWLNALVDMAEANPNYGLLGSRLINPDGSVQHVGGYFVPSVKTFMSPYRNYPADTPGINSPRECEVYIACCILVRKDVFDSVGGFDEKFFQGYEDYDLCLKIREHGYKVMYCPDSLVIHFPETSTKKLDIRTRRRIKRENARYFYQKWDQKIGGLRLPNSVPENLNGFNYYTKTRKDILDFFPSGLERVLEIGCGAGVLGRDLKTQGKAKYVCGVEIDPFAAEMAKKNLDLAISANIEHADLDLPLGSFDAIVFADVIEHLYDPWAALSNVTKYLKKDGVVIASIPNVRHYKIIKKLLTDKWFYEKEGILDRTHIRFFGYATIRDLFMYSGLEIAEIHRKKKARDWIMSISKYYSGFDDLLTYQYLIKAVKKND